MRNKLADIKARQLESANHPYASSAPAQQAEAAPTTLGDYQLLLDVDLAKLASARTLAEKQRIKAVLLPQYLDFVLGYMNQGHDYPNSVAVQVMVWLIDIGDIKTGLPLALYLVKSGQKMPQKFGRDIQTFLCDELYDWAKAQLDKQQGISPHMDLLVAVALQDQWDIHPLCLSKICVILAKYKEIVGDYEAAVTLLTTAEQVNPEKFGAKTLLDKLKKQLQKAPLAGDEDKAAA